LTVSAGSVSFNPYVYSYTTPVVTTVTSVSIVPTLNDTTATFTVNGQTATSGQARVITINVGQNIISISVTAQDGVTISNYVLNITRPPCNILNYKYNNLYFNILY